MLLDSTVTQWLRATCDAGANKGLTGAALPVAVTLGSFVFGTGTARRGPYFGSAAIEAEGDERTDSMPCAAARLSVENLRLYMALPLVAAAE